MQHAVTINFTDAESKDQACVILRYDELNVCLTVSLMSDGDTMACMSKVDARALLEGLKKATADAAGAGPETDSASA